MPTTTTTTKNQESKSFLAHMIQRLAVDRSSSRLWLLQYNNNNTSLRRRAVPTTSSHHVQWQQQQQWQAHPSLWFDYIMRQLQETTNQHQPCGVVYYWKTLPSRHGNEHLAFPKSIQMVHSISGPDPFQWNEPQEPESTLLSPKEEEEATSRSDVLPLYNLQACYEYFLQPDKAASWIFIESLQPLLLFHGFDATYAFLQKLLSSSLSRTLTLVVPIIVNNNSFLTPAQHRVLEDAAWGILCTHEYPATLVRRGIRESSNALRETLEYRVNVVENEDGDSTIPNGTWLTLELMNTDTNDDSGGKNDPVQEKEEEGSELATKSRGKVQLHFETDDPVSTSHSTKPRIYLQDNDPDKRTTADALYYYSDEEEELEDPDDDLDL